MYRPSKYMSEVYIYIYDNLLLTSLLCVSVCMCVLGNKTQIYTIIN